MNQTGTVDDPQLDPRVVKVRRAVLEVLLARVKESSPGNQAMLGHAIRDAADAADGVAEVNQACRHFAVEGPERCMFWVNGRFPRFGVYSAPEFINLAEELVERYRLREEGVVDLDVRVRVPVGIAEKIRAGEIGGFSAGGVRDESRTSDRAAAAPSPVPELAYLERQDVPGIAMQDGAKDAELAQFERKVVRYDSRRVDAFVDGIGSGPVTWFLLGCLMNCERAATREQFADRLRDWAELTTWEKANALFRLAEFASTTVIARARMLARTARAEEER